MWVYFRAKGATNRVRRKNGTGTSRRLDVAVVHVFHGKSSVQTVTHDLITSFPAQMRVKLLRLFFTEHPKRTT